MSRDVGNERTLENDFTMAHNGKLYQIQEAMLLKNVRFIPSTLIKTNLRHKGLAIL